MYSNERILGLLVIDPTFLRIGPVNLNLPTMK
jgi:hypothetical protein